MPIFEGREHDLGPAEKPDGGLNSATRYCRRFQPVNGINELYSAITGYNQNQNG